MNLIRADLGIAQITCADYNDIISNMDSISADLKIVNQYFDPITYSDYGKILLASQFRRNYLLQSFGTVTKKLIGSETSMTIS